MFISLLILEIISFYCTHSSKFQYPGDCPLCFRPVHHFYFWNWSIVDSQCCISFRTAQLFIYITKDKKNKIKTAFFPLKEGIYINMKETGKYIFLKPKRDSQNIDLHIFSYNLDLTTYLEESLSSVIAYICWEIKNCYIFL